MWLDALDLLIKDLTKKCDVKKIKSISGAGQQHGSVYLNSNWSKTILNLDPNHTLSSQIKDCLSRKISPIWMDSSTSEECGEISESLGSKYKVCSLSGSISTERFTGPQIRSFYKNELENYNNTHRIHLVSSFICSIFSGEDSPIDTGDGAGMNLMNINTFQWDNDLLNATAPNLINKLPKIVNGDTNVSQISNYFVSKYGFLKDTKITVFTGDNPSSLVGTGSSSPGKVVISLGTSDTYFAAMPKVLSDPNGYGHVFGNPTGGTMSLQCFLNGSLAREKIKDKFNFNWDEFTNALESTPVGSNGNVMLPFFSPEISPKYHNNNPIIKGTNSFENWQEPNLAVRACVEGQFLNMKINTRWMQMKPKSIYITGGASNNDAIAQIISNVFGVSVQRLNVTGSVALGGAIRAAKNNSNKSLKELEEGYCKKNKQLILPEAFAEQTYDNLSKIIKSMIDHI